MISQLRRSSRTARQSSSFGRCSECHAQISALDQNSHIHQRHLGRMVSIESTNHLEASVANNVLTQGRRAALRNVNTISRQLLQPMRSMNSTKLARQFGGTGKVEPLAQLTSISRPFIDLKSLLTASIIYAIVTIACFLMYSPLSVAKFLSKLFTNLKFLASFALLYLSISECNALGGVYNVPNSGPFTSFQICGIAKHLAKDMPKTLYYKLETLNDQKDALKADSDQINDWKKKHAATRATMAEAQCFPFIVDFFAGVYKLMPAEYKSKADFEKFADIKGAHIPAAVSVDATVRKLTKEIEELIKAKGLVEGTLADASEKIKNLRLAHDKYTGLLKADYENKLSDKDKNAKDEAKKLQDQIYDLNEKLAKGMSDVDAKAFKDFTTTSLELTVVKLQLQKSQENNALLVKQLADSEAQVDDLEEKLALSISEDKGKEMKLEINDLRMSIATHENDSSKLQIQIAQLTLKLDKTLESLGIAEDDNKKMQLEIYKLKQDLDIGRSVLSNDDTDTLTSTIMPNVVQTTDSKLAVYHDMAIPEDLAYAVLLSYVGGNGEHVDPDQLISVITPARLWVLYTARKLAKHSFKIDIPKDYEDPIKQLTDKLIAQGVKVDL